MPKATIEDDHGNEVEVVPDEASKVQKTLRRVRDWFNDEDVLDDANKRAILAGLNKNPRMHGPRSFSYMNIYGGTVSGAERQKRRTKNRRARKARRVHRLRSK